MNQTRRKHQIAFQSRYLMIVAAVFTFLPSKPEVEGLLLNLAARGVSQALQWGVVLFLSAIPTLILVIPAYRFGREELKDIRDRGFKRTWKSTIFFFGGLGLLVSFCAFRVFYWVIG